MIPLEVHRQNLAQLFSPIASLLEDPSVSEVMINGPGRIYVERAGRLQLEDARFDGEESLMSALRSVAQFAGKPLSAEHPVLEARLPDGSRLEAVIPPAAAAGAAVCIRRFVRCGLSMEELVERGTLTRAMAATLRDAVIARKNLLVSGGTGSGKTSLLGALGGLIPHDQRIITIEDAPELQLPHPHVVSLETRPPDPRGRGAVSIAALFRASLRLRPDRIVVGELRGGEALALVQAMTSGHGGCLSTIHASSPADALRRVETLALGADVAVPLAALAAQVASAIDGVVQVERRADGRRVLTGLCRVSGRGADGSYALEPWEVAP